MRAGIEVPVDVDQLVRRAQDGEGAAFAALYEHFSDAIYRYVSFKTGNPADAEDITGAVFVKMLESIGSFKPRGYPFSSWLYRIAHNLVVDYYRAKGRRKTTTLETTENTVGSSQEDLDSYVDVKIAMARVGEAMEDLTDLQREVISLRFAAGLSVNETAKAMNRKENAVKALQHAGIKKLRRTLNPGDGDGGRLGPAGLTREGSTWSHPMGRELDNALNDCLEMLANGGDLRECVARYPQYERELTPLLETAMTTRRLAASATFSPRAKARGLDMLMDAVNEGRAAPKKRGWLNLDLLRPVLKPVAVAVSALVVMGFVAGGTTAAAADSVPGDRLYWVKTTKETISLRMSRSEMEKARAHADLAGERGSEMRKLIARGKVAEAEQVADRMGSHLDRSARYSGVFVTGIPTETAYMLPQGTPRLQVIELRAILRRDGQTFRVEMTGVVARIAPDQRSHVRRMMHRSELRYRILLGALEADAPSHRLPFWRVHSSRYP